MANADRAFTMIELLVVIVMLVILAAILLGTPIFKPHPGPKWVNCMENLKQLGTGWIMYSDDNNGALPRAARFASSQTNVWALGNAQTVPQDTTRYGQVEPGVLDATNIHALTQGVLFIYVKNPLVYHCPQDKRVVDGVPYVRSYSMNNWMNGQSPAAWIPGLNASNRVYQKDVDIPRPDSRFVFIDEDPDSINQTMFTVIVDPGKYFTHIPSRNHGDNFTRRYILSFADGHVEASKFLCNDTVEWNPSKARLPEIASDGTTNQDLVKLRSEAYAPW